MATLPLETDVMDVLMNEDGTDVVVDPLLGVTLVSGKAAVRQGIMFRLRLLLGEWFMNQDIGVPWFQEILGDASKTTGVLDRARASFAAAILDTPGVTGIISMDLSLDGATRKLSVTFNASSAFGDVTGTVGSP